MKNVFAVLAFLVVGGYSCAMRNMRTLPQMQFKEQVLQSIAEEWFLDALNSKKYPNGYGNCWKAILSILLGNFGNNELLILHHSKHHVIRTDSNRKKQSLFLKDAHNIRVSSKSESCSTVIYNLIVDVAYNALLRRLQGYYTSYIPFSFEPYSYMEIPLAPEEEMTVLSNPALSFWCRNEAEPQLWAPCKVRVKGIGIEISDDGIVSFFLAMESPRPFGPFSLTVPKGPKEGGTGQVPFPKELFSSKTLSPKQVQGILAKILIKLETIPSLFKQSPFIAESSFVGDEPVAIIKKIIEDPLAPDFCFNVMKLRSLGQQGLNNGQLFERAKILLKNRIDLLRLSAPFGVFIAGLIAEPYKDKPRGITLSHVFLNSPNVRTHLQNISDISYNCWQITDRIMPILYETIERCAMDADIFSVAMLLAKSQQIAIAENNKKLPDQVIKLIQTYDKVNIKDDSASLQAKQESAEPFRHPRAKKNRLLDRNRSIDEIISDFSKECNKLNNDIEYLYNDTNIRIYRLPNQDGIFARVPTGGMNNMCPLLALGSLGENVENIRAIIGTILNLRKEKRNTYLNGSEGDIQQLLEYIAPSANAVRYDLLWFVLNPEMTQIEVGDMSWWAAMGEALNATIHIYSDEMEEGMIQEVATYDTTNASRQIYIHHRSGHYTMLIPVEEQTIDEEISRNKPFLPMF